MRDARTAARRDDDASSASPGVPAVVISGSRNTIHGDVSVGSGSALMGVSVSLGKRKRRSQKEDAASITADNTRGKPPKVGGERKGSGQKRPATAPG